MNEIVKRNDYALGEWDPFRMMREMMRWDPFRTALMMPPDREMWMPHFDVRETGDAIRIMADVPGAKRDDLAISVSGTRLVVSGHRESEVRDKDDNAHVWERRTGEFSRAFTLPDNIDVDHITSDLKEGVLTIVVPMKAGARSRKIQIGGATPKS